MAKYLPRQGDFISYWFNDQVGHEQQGRRPALVVSNDLFNKASNVLFICPVTSRDRDYPFHLAIPQGGRVNGVLMVDQIKAVDYEGRKTIFLEKAEPDLVEQVLSMLKNILQ